MQKLIKKVMHLGIDFWKDFGGFLDEKWRHVGTKIDQKSMSTSKGDFFQKTLFFLRKNNDFESSGGRSWVQKLIKNRSKNGVQDGVPLGIDF